MGALWVHTASGAGQQAGRRFLSPCITICTTKGWAGGGEGALPPRSTVTVISACHVVHHHQTRQTQLEDKT